MAGSQVTIAAAQVDAQRLGYMAISLTEFDTTAEPAIHAGSKVEISGALYQFGADEAITGWAAIASSTDAYIKLVPAGAAVTAEFTDDAPTWSDSKQGWYKTVGMAVHRYVAKLYKDAGDLYTMKRFMSREQQPTVLQWKVFPIGNWDMNATATVSMDHGLDWSKIRIVSAVIYDDAGNWKYPVPWSYTGEEDIVMEYDSAHIKIDRLTGGYFDSIDFDTAVFNRGWITVGYEG